MSKGWRNSIAVPTLDALLFYLPSAGCCPEICFSSAHELHVCCGLSSIPAAERRRTNTYFHSFTWQTLIGCCTCRALQRRGGSDHSPGLRACVRARCLPLPLLLEAPCMEDRKGFFGLERQRHSPSSAHLSQRGPLCLSFFPLGCNYLEIYGLSNWNV